MNNMKNPNASSKINVIKFLAIAALLAAQFAILPTLAASSGANGAISYSSTQRPTISISVQNSTDYQGHTDMLRASTNYTAGHLYIYINGHLSGFVTNSTTFNLDVLPIGAFSIDACANQTPYCSPTINVQVVAAPAKSTSAPSQNQSSGSGSIITSVNQTSNNITAVNNSTVQSSGNTTTTSLNGGVPITSILPVLLGIAIAVALGYTLVNNRRKNAHDKV